MKTHQIVDFGNGPIDRAQDYPFEGTEKQCEQWLEAHQQTRDGRNRFGMQLISEESSVPIYTLPQLRDGTGFASGARFLEITDTVRTTLGHARAVIEEGIHEDRHFRAATLNALTALVNDIENGVCRW